MKSPSLSYNSWRAMRNRCLNPNSTNWNLYGGRGVTICKRWDSFSLFLMDMGERPSRGHSIERRNNGGNYEPANCYWATRHQQNNNTRSNHFLTVFGETKTISQWSRDPRCIVSTMTFERRIWRGWNCLDALTTPTQLRLAA